LNISILAAGAAGMYCGSCMRDNGLAATLIRMGHAVTLVPLYTPLRTEAPAGAGPGASPAHDEVFFGGVNVYLQHASGLFRKTPRAFDWLLDRNWLLKLAGRYGADTPPEQLAGLTLTILQGEEGPAVKELRRLLEFLKRTAKPQVVSLPNLMFVGVAPTVRRELGVPVVCELTGEDIFLDAMPEGEKARIREVIRERVPAVSRFVATCGFYADRMSEYLGVAREKIDVVYPGIPSDYVRQGQAAADAGGDFKDRFPTVGYVARICPEKGLHKFLDAVLLLQKMPGMTDLRVKVAGYLGKQHQKWYAEQQARIARSNLAGKVDFRGEVDRDAKIQIIDACDVFSVPTVYKETKGVSVLEAMARGVPVVQPAHGSFPELLQLTSGGTLVRPDDPAALAVGMHELLRDPRKRRQLGDAGRQAVRQGFTEEHMARNMLKVYEGVTA
jgi:glycosyltransferase involved in cell wall biosynthesis